MPIIGRLKIGRIENIVDVKEQLEDLAYNTKSALMTDINQKC